MSIDLSLLPFEHDSETLSYSHSILNCGYADDLNDLFEKLPAQPVPPGFTSYMSRDDAYEESHYGDTTETPYGEPLTYVQVLHLLPFANKPMIKDYPMRRAVWAYLAELPPHTKIALYWH